MSDHDTEVLERPQSRASRALLTVLFRSIDNGSTEEFELAGKLVICAQDAADFFSPPVN